MTQINALKVMTMFCVKGESEWQSTWWPTYQ